MSETVRTVVDDEINRAGLTEAEAHFVRDQVIENMNVADNTKATPLSDEVVDDMDMPVDSENYFRAQRLAQKAIDSLEAH